MPYPPGQSGGASFRRPDGIPADAKRAGWPAYADSGLQCARATRWGYGCRAPTKTQDSQPCNKDQQKQCGSDQQQTQSGLGPDQFQDGSGIEAWPLIKQDLSSKTCSFCTVSVLLSSTTSVISSIR